MVDFDNDGYPNIFVTAGTVYPELERFYAKYPARAPRILFRNKGGGYFSELTTVKGSPLSEAPVSRGCAFGDFDNDGDIDVLVINTNETPTLLRNDAPDGNHWIKIKLQGTKSNRSAIGARAFLHYGGKVQAQTLPSQSSYLSANDPPTLRNGRGSHSRSRNSLAIRRCRTPRRLASRATRYYSGRSRNRRSAHLSTKVNRMINAGVAVRFLSNREAVEFTWAQ